MDVPIINYCTEMCTNNVHVTQFPLSHYYNKQNGVNLLCHRVPICNIVRQLQSTVKRDQSNVLFYVYLRDV